jgi:hypothetical protein
MRNLSIKIGNSAIFITIAVMLFSLIGCSSGGGGATATTPENAQTGTFIDAPVNGLQYSTSSWSGITGDAGAQGSFYYQSGEQVTFSIGTVVLGRTTAKVTITPLDLASVTQTTTDTKVLNIVRLLLSLDQDKDPSNGITIPKNVREALTGITLDLTNSDLDNTAGIKDMFRRLNGLGIYPEEVTGLVSAQEAQLHLENTLNQIAAEAEDEQQKLTNMALSSFISSPFGNVIMVQGQSLTLQDTVNGGKSPYTYSWYFEDSAPFSDQKDPGNIPFNTLGSYTLNCLVKDTVGNTNEDSKLITVLGKETQTGTFDVDSIPTVMITYPSNETKFKAGETVNFLATLYNGDVPLIYNWTLGSPGNSFSKGSWKVDYISPRYYLITQGIILTSPGIYSVGISVQDTNTGGRYPDTHASSVWITVE